MTNSAILGGLGNLSKSLDLGHQRLVFSCNPHEATMFRYFLRSFSDTVSSANPHGMIDLGRAAVDEQHFENFIDFTKNIERAAENSQNAPPKHPKGSSWVVLAALGGSWRPLGCVLGGSWDILGAHGSTFVALSSTGWAEARHLCRFWDPKWDRKGTQNAPKSKTKTKT